MNFKNKQEALNALKEAEAYLKTTNEEWVKIDYSVIPKEVFEKYGAKPFEIMKRKMRNENGKVWNNISWNDAKKEAGKLGYRLPTIQEMLVLLHAYKEKYPNNASVNHDEFLGIEELGYDQNNVCYEWIDAPSPCTRGGYWGDGSDGGAFMTSVGWTRGEADSNVGFRCAREC